MESKTNKNRKSKKLIDPAKIITVGHYAEDHGMPRTTVYYQVENNKLKHEVIDGVPFVYKKQPKENDKK